MDIQNFREFLRVYNNMTEVCFSQCVSTFGDRKLTSYEESCAEFCANKMLSLNRRVMQVYLEVQPKYIKRMEEAVIAAQNSQAELPEIGDSNQTQ